MKINKNDCYNISTQSDDIYRSALRKIYLNNNIPLPHYKSARTIINSFLKYLTDLNNIEIAENLNELAHNFLFNIYGLKYPQFDLAS